VVKGQIQLEDFNLTTGDGAGLSLEMSVSFTAQEPTEILLFDWGRLFRKKSKRELKTRQPPRFHKNSNKKAA
jgi:hypothetical protein